jgi:competence protein ComEC
MLMTSAGTAAALAFLVAVASLDLHMADAQPAVACGGVGCCLGMMLLWNARTRQTGAALMAVSIGCGLAGLAVLRESAGHTQLLPDAWLAPFAAARENVEVRIGMLLPEPHAALLTGLLTGARTSMPKDFVEALRVAGIIHIVAISGYNITLVLTVVERLLRWIPRNPRRIIQITAVALFTVFVGADPPVVRAAIMGTLGVIAIEGGRMPDVRRGMLWAAVLMLLARPSQLIEDMGFQLSFLSLMGIVELSPFLLPLDRWIPQTLGLRESVRTTIAAQLGTFPWIAAMFGSIPLLALPANVAVAPLVPAAMFLGTAAVATDALWPAAGRLIGYGTWAVLQGIVLTAETVDAVPGASVAWQPPVLAALAVYAATAILLFRRATTGTSAPSPASPIVLLPCAPRLVADAGTGNNG